MLRAILASLALVSLCLSAGCSASAGETDSGEEATAGADALSKGSSATCSATTHHLGGDENGFYPVHPTCAHVTVDGKACSARLADITLHAKQGQPYKTPGWTLEATVTCGSRDVVLSLAGKEAYSPKEYPQVGAKSFDDKPAAAIILEASGARSLATSSTIQSGVVLSGPGGRIVGVVQGKAHVAGEGGDHDLSYTFGF